MTTTWDTKDRQKYPPLKEDLEADIVIIGGGLAGIWTAYQLSEAGKKVVVLEKDRIGMGETYYTTAFLTHAIDTPLAELVKIFGKRNSQLIWLSHKEAIDLIEKTIKKERIECDFMRLPVYEYATTDKDLSTLEEEHKWAKEFGYKTKLKKVEDKDLDFKNCGSLAIENQAKYHPMKFLVALARKAVNNGAQIFEKTEVEKITGNGPVKAVTKDGFTIRAQQAAILTYDPLGNPRATKFKKGMYVSSVLELEIMKGTVEEGLYMDTYNPYHYVRVDKDALYDTMIVGGEDYRGELKVSKEKSFKALEDYVKETFPQLKYKIKRKWQGQILEPTDGLALIGRVAEGRLVGCAFSGNGMTYSAITGTLLTDIIMKRKNRFIKIYDPERHMSLKALSYKARDYAGEFLGGAAKNLLKRNR